MKVMWDTHKEITVFLTFPKYRAKKGGVITPLL
jgi:hypothetical protein